MRKEVFPSANAYAFQPLNDSFSFYSGSTIAASGAASVTISTGGYWTGSGQNFTFNKFTPGTYTVIGADEWGNVVFLPFSVPQVASRHA